MMSVGSNLMKYLLFLFNVLFVVTGLVLLSVGAAIKGVYSGYHVFLDDRYFSAPNLLIAVGLIILLVSFLGCCGAIKENHCMIVSYIALLVLIFILELSGGIAGYVCRDQAEAVLTEKLTASMKNYGSDTVITQLWDAIQRTFECCGSTKLEDWKIQQNRTDDLLPHSCCPLATGFENVNCTRDGSPPNAPGAYKAVCTDKFGDFIRDEAVVIGGVGVSIAIIQLLGIIMAYKLATEMRRAASSHAPM